MSAKSDFMMKRWEEAEQEWEREEARRKAEAARPLNPDARRILKAFEITLSVLPRKHLLTVCRALQKEGFNGVELPAEGGK